MDGEDFIRIARDFAKKLPSQFNIVTFGVKGKTDAYTLDLTKSEAEIVLEANESLVLTKIPTDGITAKNLAAACHYSVDHLRVILRGLRKKHKVKREKGLWLIMRKNK